MSCSSPATGPDNRLALAIRRCLGVSLSGALLTLPLAALAQEDTAVDEADTMVVLGTALKVEAPLVETPRSASVVTREELNERNVQKLDETFRYRAGVLSGHYGADNDTDWFKVRGFDQSTYLDGSRLFINEGYYRYVLEPFGLERVELLKGPASILYGEAPPGGVINAISKRPTEEERGLLEAQIGNRNHRQVAFDTSGPVNENGDIRYRMIGLYSEREGDVEHTENERYFFAPSVSIDLSDDTDITFLTSIQKDDAVPVNPFKPTYGTIEDTPYGKIEPSTNLGEPGYDKNERTQVSLGYELNHQFDDTWGFQQNFRYGHLDLELRSAYAFLMNNDGRTVNRGLVYRDGEANSWAVDNKFIGHWYSQRTENTLLLGADYQHLDIEAQEGPSSDFYPFGSPIDVFDPEYGNYSPVTNGQLLDHELKKEQIGLYVQDQLRLDDRWVFLLGARYDQAETRDVKGGAIERSDDNEVSLSGGVMYLAENGLSPYLSYMESFNPIGQTDGEGALYEPMKGEQWEVGVKYASIGFDGYVNAAVFDITETNALVTDGAVSRQVGERSSQGVELESVGYLTDSLQLVATYTYTDATMEGGERTALIPRHMASAWLDYEFTGGVLDGLKLGGGLRYKGESTDGGDVSVPSYTVYDAMARYDFAGSWRAQVNVNNITDKEYVAGCEAGLWCYYGESRSVIGSLSYRW